MIVKASSPEVVSLEPYVATPMESVFMNEEGGKICLIEHDAAYEITLED